MMKRSGLLLAAFLFSAWLSPSPVLAEGHPIAGVEMGVVQPVEALDQYTDVGGVFSPFAGYMFNDYVGLMGQLQVVGAPNFNRPGIRDDDATWATGGAIGPRLALPLGEGEIYGTAQGGLFTGLTPNGSITGTSLGFSVGGGVSAPIVDKVKLGIWGRFNRFYQRVHSTGDVEYVSAGIGLTFDLGESPSTAPPPRVAVVPPPPPPPPAPEEAPAPPPVKRKIVLRGVNFDFDKTEIRADAKPVLDEAIRVLGEETAVAVIAVGHTDSLGSTQYNQNLSVRRAKAVRDYLVAGGVDAARISVEGRGESESVADNGTRDGRAQNRRVELRIKGE